MLNIPLILSKKVCFLVAFIFSRFLFLLILFFPLLISKNILFPFSLLPFDICQKYPFFWKFLKLSYFLITIFSSVIIGNAFFVYFSKKYSVSSKESSQFFENSLCLLIGLYNGNNIYIPKEGLFQNILVTGTIGTGKTSSAMYPFSKQLIDYNSGSSEKIGMLFLDVKGNFHKQILKYCLESNRFQDLIIIELNSSIKYNPLHKPNLKASVLANRLKTILTLFATNNSDSYWLDKAEQVLTECIKLCRLYNNGYVTFVEIHNLINIPNYYIEKLKIMKNYFQQGILSNRDIFDLHSVINFFENEFIKLDPRILSILKSEITRITNTFISDYDILSTFCAPINELTFLGFDEVIRKGKIVVLNMNISEYRNLSKIMAAYLKLDFQSEVLMQLSKSTPPKISAFVCDEYHEYVTITDADFFAQSREAKCINIVATQSYSSLLNTLKEQSAVKVIVQNLINKLWFRSDDIFTIEDAQKQIGKEEKTRISKSISENAQETKYNYFTGKLNSKNSSLSESISTYTHSDYIYDTNFFTQSLETFSCLAFISDGIKIQTPCKLQLIPYFKLLTNSNIPNIKNYNKII